MKDDKPLMKYERGQLIFDQEEYDRQIKAIAWEPNRIGFGNEEYSKQFGLNKPIDCSGIQTR
jgi:hypothetical protein